MCRVDIAEDVGFERVFMAITPSRRITSGLLEISLGRRSTLLRKNSMLPYLAHMASSVMVMAHVGGKLTALAFHEGGRHPG